MGFAWPKSSLLRSSGQDTQFCVDVRNMTAETLNFGPEWLRALSSGGSVTSPPPSPAMPKYKLAEYRYGREEMLALYIKDNKVPEDMQDKEFAAILQDEPMQPLALVPLTEEEQRNFSMSVNSVAVLRLMGKGVGGAAPAGVVRGRGATRGGRGRGRGEGGFYQRSIEDVEVGFGRSVREIHRSQSWDDRGERRFEKPLRREVGRPGFEEAGGPGGPGRKEYTRADSDNWRTLREEQEEDEGEPGSNWRLAGPRRDDGGPRSAGWRDHSGPGESRRRKFDFDFRDSEGHGGGRRRAGSEGLEDDRDGLPEWCTDEEDSEMGTFDSSGAFMPMKKGGKETILEEEFEFRGIEEEEDESLADNERNSAEGDKDKESKEAGSAAVDGEAKLASPSSSPPTHCTPPSLEPQPSNAGPVVENTPSGNSQSQNSSTPGEERGSSRGLQGPAKPPVPPPLQSASPTPSSAARFSLHLEETEAMRHKAPAAGPFTTVEMCEWFQAGLLHHDLVGETRAVARLSSPWGCHQDGAACLSPGALPPPLLVRQPPVPRPAAATGGPPGTVSQSSASVEDGRRMQERILIDRCSEQGMMQPMNDPMSRFQLLNSFKVSTAAGADRELLQQAPAAGSWGRRLRSWSGVPPLGSLEQEGVPSSGSHGNAAGGRRAHKQQQQQRAQQQRPATLAYRGKLLHTGGQWVEVLACGAGLGMEVWTIQVLPRDWWKPKKSSPKQFLEAACQTESQPTETAAAGELSSSGFQSEEESLALASGCALFAALYKEDLIYSQPMNQLTRNLFFELKP
ncbi:GRB10-interacting GYF protein 1 isoform X1 [Lates japonicus]|uniref:GRB10-interacting GYF protein 1 isoform X1 n=1 Tax=Lates japonicus TaxID=270547 RepID=A0AAD3NH83_LATJO|nr:GRB10-interacting GYF protein 1 isoform X1 [Lates japonicus]